MFTFIIFIILLFIIIYMITNHVHIKYKTFLQKGFFKTSKPYGVYCYCGKQGKGKTYSVVEFLLNNSNQEIFCNISSIKGLKYNYINGIDELLSLRNKTNCIIVFDEIFTILQKGTKMNDDILDFLSQMRKREMIFITTAQEWLEINMTLRRYCRYQIECNMISIFGYPILFKKMYDAEKMKWSQEENEYIAPLISTTISHGLKKVILSYDTYEQIGKYSTISKNQNKGIKNIDLDEIKKNETDFSVSQKISFIEILKKILKYVKHKLSLFTTTIKKACAKCQFTNKFTKNKDTLHNNSNNDNLSIDKDFWETSNKSSLEEV